MVVFRYFLLKHLNSFHSNINLTKFFTWSDEELFPYLRKPTKDARHNQPLTYMLIWVCYFSPFYRWENGRKKISGSHRDSLLRRDYTFGGHLESPQSPLCVFVGGCVLRHSGLVIFLCSPLTALMLSHQHLSNCYYWLFIGAQLPLLRPLT